MAKSKFFRIAVAGPTIDGREIKPEWLQQMAANYDPATYTARINCEHIAGYSPDRPFNAYGSVAALKTEMVELTVNGQKQNLLGLYAQIDANDQLIDMVRRDQKIFTSCEVNENFLGKGEAYLVGLAATDFPASVGTERLKFAAMARPNLFSSALETEIVLEATPLDSDAIGKSIGESILAFFRKDRKDEPATPPANPKPANDNGFDAEAFASAFGASVAQQIAAATRPANDAVAAVQADLAKLTAQLEATEQPGTFRRAPAAGGSNEIATDC